MMLTHALLFFSATLAASADPESNAPQVRENADPRYRCTDGSRVAKREQCPAEMLPAPPPAFAVPLPVPLDRLMPAKPRNNPGMWVGTFDYPSRALLNEWMGQAQFRLTVGKDGRVAECEITRTSGYVSIDLATCSNIRRRARFMPALDAQGNPTTGTYANRVTWKIPAESDEEDRAISQAIASAHDGVGPDASPRGRNKKPDPVGYDTWIPDEPLPQSWRYKDPVSYIIAVNQQGTVDYCFVEYSSGDANFDGYVCRKVTENARFAPATDNDGMPTKGQFMGGFAPAPLQEVEEAPVDDVPVNEDIRPREPAKIQDRLSP